MNNEPTKIASYLAVEEAEIARARLQEEGITAFVDNANTLGMAWHLSNAVGGVVLQVGRQDVDRAMAILDDEPRDSDESASESADERDEKAESAGLGLLSSMKKPFFVLWLLSPLLLGVVIVLVQFTTSISNWLTR